MSVCLLRPSLECDDLSRNDYNIYEQAWIEQINVKLSDQCHLNWDPQTNRYSDKNCQLASLIFCYIMRQSHTNWASIDIIPNKQINQSQYSCLMVRYNDGNAAYCLQHLTEDGYFAELYNEQYAKYALKHSDFQQIIFDDDDNELNDIRRQLKNTAADAPENESWRYELENSILGITPFHEYMDDNIYKDSFIPNAILQHSKTQKNAILKMVNKYGLIFDDNDEINFFVKLFYNKHLTESHWVNAVVRGDKNSLKTLVYINAQSSIPTRITGPNRQLFVACNNLLELLQRNVYSAHFYALSPHIQFKNAALLCAEFESRYISKSSYNIYRMSTCFSNWMAKPESYNFCKLNEHESGVKKFKHMLSQCIETPMIDAMLKAYNLSSSAPPSWINNQMSPAMLRYSPRKKYTSYKAWHCQQTKEKIIEFNPNISRRIIIEKGSLMDLLFKIAPRPLDVYVQIFLVSLHLQKVIVTKCFGFEMVTFEPKKGSNAPNILFAEQCCLMSAASGYPFPCSSERKEDCEKYKYHLSQSTILSKAVNLDMSANCAYFYSMNRLRDKSILMSEINECLYDIVLKNKIGFDLYPKLEKPLEYISEQIESSDATTLYRKLEAEWNAKSSSLKQGNMGILVAPEEDIHLDQENEGWGLCAINDHSILQLRVKDLRDQESESETEEKVHNISEQKEENLPVDYYQNIENCNFGNLISRNSYNHSVVGLKHYLKEFEKIKTGKVIPFNVMNAILHYYGYIKKNEGITKAKLIKYMKKFINFLRNGEQRVNYPKYNAQNDKIENFDGLVRQLSNSKGLKKDDATNDAIFRWTLSIAITHCSILIVAPDYYEDFDDDGNLDYLCEYSCHLERRQISNDLNMQYFDRNEEVKAWKMIRFNFNWFQFALNWGFPMLCCHGRSYWEYNRTGIMCRICCWNPRAQTPQIFTIWRDKMKANDGKIDNDFIMLLFDTLRTENFTISID